MKLVGAGGQSRQDYGFRADGSIAVGGTPQLVLPQTSSRSLLMIVNNSADGLWFDFGSARAHCAITSGAVSSITVDNGGFGFTHAPRVRFIGGLAGVASTLAVAGNDTAQPEPVAAYGGRPARAVAVLSGGAVASITILDGGSGYTNPPMVFLSNAREDPFGCADPSVGSGNGVLLAPSGGGLNWNGTMCPTDQMAVWGPNANAKYFVMWAP